ncbi:MAG: nucleotide pyrophosphohydrolase [bacterium]|nr:nucleotide pyrophosphohydrolase [bacterium]
MEELIRKLREFAAERDWEQFHSPKNLSMALAVEVAEIIEHFQWLTQEESRSVDPEVLERVREEIGDVQIYLARLADQLGISPLEAALEKLEINRRKYPPDKARGRATKSTDLDR